MTYRFLSLTAVLVATPLLALAEPVVELEAMTVSADLRGASAADIPTSVHGIDALHLEDSGSTHLEQQLRQTPNVNTAGGSSRVRYVQIRGMGEREDYSGTPNTSVGVMLDGMDFSNAGMVGTLFDAQQIEVLRGPQSTRYGASAIAGLVNIETKAPTPYRESLLETTLGNDNLRQIGLMTSGPMAAGAYKPQYRFTLFSHHDDGFRNNHTLNRRDTNQREELTARAKLRWWAGSDTQFDATLLHSDLDNGYDIFTPTNDFNTYSDETGKDTQRTYAGRFKVRHTGLQRFDIVSQTTASRSRMLYNYDEDWGPEPDGFYENRKQRKHYSQEMRLVSSAPIFAETTDWVWGVYGARLEEDNENGVRWGEWSRVSRDYRQDKLATFLQLDHHFTDATTLVLGARVEDVSSRFHNSDGESYKPSKTFWGGELTLHHQLDAANSVYGGVSRGYKAGGFNTGLQANAEDKYRFFRDETALNYELGYRFNTATLRASVNVFYTDRRRPQFDGNGYDPSVIGTGDNPNWVFFIENFDSASNYGAELAVEWQATDALSVFVNGGWLGTRVSGAPLNADFSISGRDQTHAPRYQYAAGAQYRHASGWFGRAEIEGLGSYFFDNVHDAKSKAYTLTHARVGYEAASWEVYLWARNLFNEHYANRGFHFDLDGTGDKTWLGLADPRQFGITTRVHF